MCAHDEIVHPEGGLLLHDDVDEADVFPCSQDAPSFSDPVSGAEMACLFRNMLPPAWYGL